LLTVTGDDLQNASKDRWKREINTLKNILQKYSNIHPDDILGIRSPKNRPGGNNQIRALVESGFVWDSSFPTKGLQKPLWPYTVWKINNNN
jgi:hypothetical protein